MVEMAMLIALVVVLQMLGSFIKIGPLPMSFVLVPIVIGACLLGTASGAVLGGVLNENVYRNEDVKSPEISGEMILGSLRVGDILLVKASRGAAAERVINYIKENRDRICL